ncbi:hypothetical protein [Wenjunlia tyrosinilytica]|uniref:ATP-grasp domain-containing protein n=1 Tax=Wenjunlia tyrosinilytica TaxID=1544741 RepID=A0A918E1B3_9ACTN|nr:hypothetical protein [Wenjunlia tyrosinilytica]GGO95818.1 hypothetical protein GCM10012280_53860 [Wenjunlia tyrosinilytica]
MTTVILDRPSGPLHPYPRWLGDSGGDLALLTGRPPAELGPGDLAGYAEVRSCADYATSTEVERCALDLAHRTRVTSLVAIDSHDLVRAAALRDHLGIPGQTREQAVVLQDLVLARRALERAGVPAPVAGPVQRVADLYWYAHRWGYPLRVRRRRTPGWAETAVLTNEAAVRALTLDGLSHDPDAVPALIAERYLEGPRHRVAAVPDDDGTWMLRRTGWTGVAAARPDAPLPEDLAALVRAALDVLSPRGNAPHLVEAVRGRGGQWLVESVACGLRDTRADEVFGGVHGWSVYAAAARAQAGLPIRRVTGMVA